MDGMIIRIQKRKILRYKEIVKKLINNEDLSKEQKEFLKKEKILE